MKKIHYRLVYNRKNHLNSERKALIQVEASLEGKKRYISTHLYVTPEHWNEKAKRIVKHPQEEFLNRMLDEFILGLQQKELDGWKHGKEVSLFMLQEETKRKDEESFIKYGRKWVDESSRRDSTKRNLHTTLDLIEKYKKGVLFCHVNYMFLLSFEKFLHSTGHSMNTVAKHMRQIKTIYNEGIRRGIVSVTSSPFTQYMIKTVQSKHAFLLPEDMEKLESLVLRIGNKLWKHSLDAFLFCCYTGLRYSDFTRISAENIQFPDGHNAWLVFESYKTKVETRIPLYLLFQGKALSILKRYPVINNFFRARPNSAINKDLIRLGRLAGINKHFSFHTARHTNATLLIYKGANITTVQKLLGHRSIKTTQIYGEVFSDTIIEDLKRCNR